MSLPKRPAEGPGEKAALDAAGQWLDAAIVRDARAFALGEERTFDVDQGAARLTLQHADGGQVDLDIQILGSFRPQNGSLRWGWANTSIDPKLIEAVGTARDHPSTTAFPSFATPTFEASFEDCVRLAALAAKLGGCDGVYRCLAENALTVFAGYKAPPALAAAVNVEQEKAATALLDAYDAEMAPLDEAYQRVDKKNRDRELMDKLLSEKLAVYRRYWRRDDQYWEPCSFQWPSDHLPSRQVRRFVVPRRNGGLYVITQKQHGQNANVVEFFPDGPRITDEDIDWGSGVLLSTPEGFGADHLGADLDWDDEE